MDDLDEMLAGIERHAVTSSQDFGPPAKRTRISRRLALLIVAGVVLLLALGWAVDGLAAFAPAVHFTNGSVQQAGNYRVALTLDPATPRVEQSQRFIVRISDPNGHAIDGARVQLRLTMATMDMPSIQMTAAPDGGGSYSTTAALSMPGEWHLDVLLTPPGDRAVTTRFDIAAR